MADAAKTKPDAAPIYRTVQEARAANPLAAVIRWNSSGFIAFKTAGDAIGHPTAARVTA